MSRQYDEFIEGSFKLHGERHWLVMPETFNELLKAYEVRDLLREGCSELMHDEDSSELEALMQDQEDYIKQFINDCAEFDNGILNKNLAFLLKKYKLKMGDLEKTLGISTGYISRTTKENSVKKLSIDVVWKIAELFEISVDRLINDDISELSGNIRMLADFIDKLYNQTKSEDIEWYSLGGVHSETDDRFNQLGIFTVEKDGFVRYSAPDKNLKVRLQLADDVIGTCSVDRFRQLIIIPFKVENKAVTHYDFVFVWTTEDSKTYTIERVFCSHDDHLGTLDCHATALYREVEEHFMNVPISINMRKFIIGYLGKGGD